MLTSIDADDALFVSDGTHLLFSSKVSLTVKLFSFTCILLSSGCCAKLRHKATLIFEVVSATLTFRKYISSPVALTVFVSNCPTYQK